MEKDRARSDMGSYPGSTQDRSCEGIGKQAAAWLLQTECVMAARETRPDVRWKRLEGRLKATAEIQKLLTRTVLSHFCFIRKKKQPFKLDWAISHSSSSPQLFQPIFPTNLAFETLQILGPHLIFSLKPRCFLVAAGCCDWVWRKTNGLQAVGLPNGTRRRPTYIRWASKTAVPTKNLTEGTSVRKAQPGSRNHSKRGIHGSAQSLFVDRLHWRPTQPYKLPGNTN